MIRFLDESPDAQNGYALRGLAFHLKECRDYDLLYSRLLNDSSWLERKSRQLGTNESYLEDLRIALTTFPPETDARQALILVQLAVARHTANSAGDLHTDVDLETLTWLGDENLARAYARMREDPSLRILGLLAVWRALRARGRDDRLLLMSVGDNAALVQDPFQRIRHVMAIAEVMDEIGEKEQSDAHLTSSFDELSALHDARIATTLTNEGTSLIVAVGQEPERYTVAAEADEGLLHEDLQRLILEARIRLKQFAKAERLIPTIHSVSLRVRLWGALSKALQAEGDQERSEAVYRNAIQQARTIADPAPRAFACCALLRSQSGPDEQWDQVRSEIEEAARKVREEIAESSEFQLGKSQALHRLNAVIGMQNLCKIARALNDAGRREAAMWVMGLVEQLALQIVDEAGAHDTFLEATPLLYKEQYIAEHRAASAAYFGRKDDALAEVTVAWAALGAWEQAMDLLGKIQGERALACTRYQLALSMARSGRIREACDLAFQTPLLPLYETERGVQFVSVTGFNTGVYRPSHLNTHTHVIHAAVESLLAQGRLGECENMISEVVNRYLADRSGTPGARLSLLAERDSLRGSLLRLAARAHAASGSAGKARDLLAGAHRCGAPALAGGQTALTVVKIMEVFAQYGRLNAAQNLLRHIGSTELLLDAHRILAVAQAKTRDPEDLIRARDRLTVKARNLVLIEQDGYLKAGGLRIIAKALFRIGCRVEAVDTFREALQESLSLDQPGMKAHALLQLAEATYSMGDSDAVDVAYRSAIEAAGEADPRSTSIYLYSLIGESLHRNGRSDWADRCYEAAIGKLGLRYPLSHCTEAARVIVSLAKTGRFEIAAGLTSTMCDDHRYRGEMFETLGTLVCLLAKAGEYEKAATMLLAITDPSVAAETLSAVAAIAMEAGNQAVVERAARLATLLTDRMTDSRRRESVLAKLASIEAKSGHIREALEALEAITGRATKIEGFRLFSNVEMEAGRFLSALSNLRCETVEDLIETLAMWAPAFAALDPALPPKILTGALRIVVWGRPEWSAVQRVVATAQNHG